MLKSLKIIAKRVFIGLLISLALFASGLYWMYAEGLHRPLPLAEDTSYILKPGTSLRRAALELAQAKIMDYPTALAWAFVAQWEGKAQQVKAGEYEIPAHSSAREILLLFVSGKTRLHTLTLYAGWNFRQVLAELRKHPKLKQDTAGLSAAQIMSKLGHAGQHPEGRFFPDTYYFSAGMSDLELLKQAYELMEKELTSVWKLRAADAMVNTPEEALILASIVEKETGKGEEYPLIAGVFSLRLQKDMKLQTDPSVIYGLGEGFNGNLRRKDLLTDTPYNTYTRKGLPPTPIAMPGRAALHAAVRPEIGKLLYFVAKGDGSHYFSSNLKEHQCAVIEYQLKPHAPEKFAQRCQARPDCAVCRET